MLHPSRTLFVHSFQIHILLVSFDEIKNLFLVLLQLLVFLDNSLFMHWIDLEIDFFIIILTTFF